MSQAVHKSEFTDQKSHDESTLFGEEVYTFSVENPEEVRRVQAYVRENPGTTVFIDYEMDSAVSRGINEKLEEFEGAEVYKRLIGGMSEHIDQGSYGVITSDGCYQDFKLELAEKADKVIESEISSQNKDIFLSDEQKVDEMPKVIGTSLRIHDPNYEDVYGAIWREEAPGVELREAIDEDVVDATAEEYENSTYPIQEEEEESLWDEVREEAEEISADRLLEEDADPGRHEINSGNAHPMSCPVEVRADTTDKNTPGRTVGEVVERKSRTS